MIERNIEKSKILISKVITELEQINCNDYSILLVSLYDINFNEKEKLLYVFSELINVITIVEHDDVMCIIYYNDNKLAFSEIINAINFDLNMNMKIYSSRKNLFERSLNYPELFALIMHLFECESDNYFDISKIILQVVNIKPNYLSNLKTIVLSDFLKDQSNIKIAIGMFENNLNVTKTAKELYMHRNTLNYKLDYIYNITNLNLQIFNHAIAMYILLNS